MQRRLFIAVSVFLLMLVSFPVVQVHATTDNVFVDENDGDFDAYSIYPEYTVIDDPEEGTKVIEVKRGTKELPKVTHEEPKVAHEEPKAVQEESKAPPAKAAEPVKQVEKPKKPKPVAEKKTRTKSTGAGLFVRTKEPCPMLREPASDSPAMLTVKASRKIWVQEVDEDWVRAFNKAGEPGYLQRDCLE